MTPLWGLNISGAKALFNVQIFYAGLEGLLHPRKAPRFESASFRVLLKSRRGEAENSGDSWRLRKSEWGRAGSDLVSRLAAEPGLLLECCWRSRTGVSDPHGP